MGERLGDADQLALGIPARRIVERQPVGGAGMGVGPAELDPVMGPDDGGGKRRGKIAAGQPQARQLARLYLGSRELWPDGVEPPKRRRAGAGASGERASP